MGFLDIPPSAASDSAITAAINTPGSTTKAALDAAYTSPQQAAGLSAALSIVFGG